MKINILNLILVAISVAFLTMLVFGEIERTDREKRIAIGDSAHLYTQLAVCAYKCGSDSLKYYTARGNYFIDSGNHMLGFFTPKVAEWKSVVSKYSSACHCDLYGANTANTDSPLDGWPNPSHWLAASRHLYIGSHSGWVYAPHKKLKKIAPNLQPLRPSIWYKFDMAGNIYAFGRNKGAYLPVNILHHDGDSIEGDTAFLAAGEWYWGNKLDGQQENQSPFLPPMGTSFGATESSTRPCGGLLDSLRGLDTTFHVHVLDHVTVPVLGYGYTYGGHSLPDIRPWPPQSTDTLTPVWLLVVDTAHLVYYGRIGSGGNRLPPEDVGVNSWGAFMIPAFLSAHTEEHEILTHYTYLDANKHPLQATLVVWDEMAR